MTHDLKTWTEPFAAIWSGAKVHELRVDDRGGYNVGDFLRLHKFDEFLGKYSRPRQYVLAEVTYVTKDAQWGLGPGVACMSIRVMARETEKYPHVFDNIF